MMIQLFASATIVGSPARTISPPRAGVAVEVGGALDVLGDDEVGERDSVAQRRKACHGRVPPS
jgi:hypothetical protein